jgi:DNA-binding NarL/FixJ family response regulator
VIRVVVVDDHDVVRLGLTHAIGSTPDMGVVGAARDGSEAIDVVHRTSPDVVLMDLSMPRMGGLEATRRIVARHPQVRVVVLTAMPVWQHEARALAAGAVAYLPKDGKLGDLLSTIRRVAHGGCSPDASAERPAAAS